MFHDACGFFVAVVELFDWFRATFLRRLFRLTIWEILLFLTIFAHQGFAPGTCLYNIKMNRQKNNNHDEKMSTQEKMKEKRTFPSYNNSDNRSI